MKTTQTTYGAALALNPQAIACVAAVIGNTLAAAILKDYALQGLAALDIFAKDCAAVFAADNGFAPGTGLATMAKASPAPKGLKTFCSYLYGLRKLAKAGDTAAILAATGRDLAGTNKPTEKRAPKTTSAPAPAARPFTIDDALACIVSAHKAGSLAPEHYAALAALVPASTVRNMGPVEYAAPMLAH